MLNFKDLFQGHFESPDKNHDLQGSFHENYSEPKYYTVKQSRTLFQKAKRKNGLPVLHFNMRSLLKNLSFLEDIITIVKEPPEIIAISETKLKENYIHNIEIPGYAFINTNSRTAAGVGSWMRRDLELSGDNIEPRIEPCWVQIRREKLNNMHLSAPIKSSSTSP